MTELILGTAEFNPQGYAGKPCPSEQEIVRILNLAWEGGIRTLDCADTYGTEQIEKYFTGFRHICKTRNLNETRPYFYHYKPGEARIEVSMASVYELAQLPNDGDIRIGTLIVPFSISNTTFSHKAHHIVRSIFDRGRLLADGYTVKECLSFVLRHRPQGIIVGVNSVHELQEVLHSWEYLRPLSF